MRVPWTARRSNQSILKEINPEYSLEGSMLKLKLQYSGHLIRRADSLEKILMLRKIESKRRRGQQLDGITDSMDVESEQAPGVGEGQGTLACCSPWGHKESNMSEQQHLLLQTSKLFKHTHLDKIFLSVCSLPERRTPSLLCSIFSVVPDSRPCLCCSGHHPLLQRPSPVKELERKCSTNLRQ